MHGSKYNRWRSCIAFGAQIRTRTASTGPTRSNRGQAVTVLKHPTAPLLCSMVRVGREVLTIRATTVLLGGSVGSDGEGTDCSQRYLVCRTVHVFLYGVRRSSAGPMPMNIPTYLHKVQLSTFNVRLFGFNMVIILN